MAVTRAPAAKRSQVVVPKVRIRTQNVVKYVGHIGVEITDPVQDQLLLPQRLGLPVQVQVPRNPKSVAQHKKEQNARKVNKTLDTMIPKIVGDTPVVAGQ